MRSPLIRKKVAAGCLVAASFFSGKAESDEPSLPTTDKRPTPTATSDILSTELSSESLPKLTKTLRLEDKRELDTFFEELRQTTATHAEIEIFDDNQKVIKRLELPLGEEQKQNEALVWLGIATCLLSSACLSGMNIGLMRFSRLDLEIKAEQGDADAAKVLTLREDGNTSLATILWGNVGVNCLLTLLSDSALAGATGFGFSVLGVTLLGEILPQGYFSRNSLFLTSKLAPALKALTYALYPISKPSGLLLDKLVGKERVDFWQEEQLEAALRYHLRYPNPEIGPVEAQGAANFLAIDDINLCEEGCDISPTSIIQVVNGDGEFTLPSFQENRNDPFVRRVNDAGVPWVVLTDAENNPRYLLDADAFLRHCWLKQSETKLEDFCHTPLVVEDPEETLGLAIKRFEVAEERSEAGVIDNDVILFWNDDCQKIVTGADILAKLLQGVVKTPPLTSSQQSQETPA